MTAYDLLYAIGDVNDAMLVFLQEEEESVMSNKKKKGAIFLKWSIAVAACMLAVFIAIPIVNIFMPHHTSAPVTKHYESLAEAQEALGLETLYSRLALDDASVRISYQSDEAGEARMDMPLQLQIKWQYQSANVYYYIIFNRDDVQDSYIGGYVEQGLSKEMDGVTVHYSEVFNGREYNSQAKFVYDGDLYVMDIVSHDRIDLDVYLEMLFG